MMRSLISTLRAPLLLVTAILASGCAGKFASKIDFDPAEPLRVAVLPFAFVDEKGEIVAEDSDLVVDSIPLVSSELGESATAFVETLVYKELERSGLDVIPHSVVLDNIVHNGLANGLDPDVKKLYQLKPRDLCDLLNCDAVLFGKVTAWDRSYYGLQTINRVGIDLKLVNAATGKTLFEAQGQDTDNRGLSKGPTGWSSLVIEPVKGLDNAVITALAREVVTKALNPLYVKSRPPVLDTAPPAILASSHDSVTGVISPDRPLTVLMFGTPEQSASFSIGNKVENIPMIEKSSGHYLGEYYPVPNESFEKETVTVQLRDSYGRLTEQRIGLSPVTVH